MERLAAMGQPNVAVITNIGMSHIENLGSQEGIFKAKMEITKNFTRDNTLIVNGDDKFLSTTKDMGDYKVVYYGIDNPENDVYAKNIVNKGLDGVEFIAVADGREYAVEVTLPGKHNVYNALAAICVGREFGVPIEDSVRGIKECEYTSQRLEVEEIGGVQIINDCYNASPDSIRAALEVLGKSEKPRKIAVLGDVLEMGDYARDAHYDLGKSVVECGADMLVTAGENAAYIAEGAKDCGMNNVKSFPKTLYVCNYIKDVIQSGDAVLIKASHGMRFEDIYKSIKESLKK
ncbi:MAG: UDP-N-acetylmuramoyl-tripeptide--D-alanyl-D-alanine ligase [Oscillospiraceae bacterium]|nr:UDP-N-acetylmuramoyl-tripeptide--D-alanyl-D-alanine ligase [Oscillospiraceae bacterium]